MKIKAAQYNIGGGSDWMASFFVFSGEENVIFDVPEEEGVNK